MKINNKKIGSVLYLCFVIAIVIMISACTMGDSTIAPQEEQLMVTKNVEILKFKNVNPSLNKNVTATQPVTIADGGVLELYHEINDDASINITFEVLANTINQDTEISLVLDDDSVELQFSPHGLTFSQPAILNITGTGLDLEGIDPNSISLFYDNTEIGQWEEVYHEGVTVNTITGFVTVQNAKIPHFSRYALGGGE